LTLHANNIAGARYKNKFECSETPTRTGTVTVVSAACQTMTEPERSWDIGEISAVTVRFEQLPTDCSMHIFSRVQDQYIW